jgi:hypothetical protein
MVPGPLFASPPLTDQVTLAAPPPVSVALNCSTDAPEELVALQPVQFVSIAVVPGVIAKMPFDGFADTPPLVQPAASSSAGARIIASARSRVPVPDWFAACTPPMRALSVGLFIVACVVNGKCFPAPWVREVQLTA